MTPGSVPDAELSPSSLAARELLRSLGIYGSPAQIAVTTYGPDGPVTVHLSA